MGNIIHQSVSGILRYQNESFIVQRAFSQRYFPGYWCFPGGKVSKIDGVDEKRFIKTLIRETQEELGINISEEQIRKIDITTTPSSAPYRFENHFYIVEMDSKEQVQLDDEHRDGFWIKDEEIGSFFSRSDVLTIPPIPHYLKSLASKEKYEYHSQYIDTENKILKASYIHHIDFFMVPSLALPPSKHTNTLIIGEQKKLLVDPSPKFDEHVEVLISVFMKYDIQGIFVSHWHPDHHQNIRIFCEKLNLPLYLSEQTYNEIIQRWGEEYFSGLSLNFLSPGDFIDLGDMKLEVIDNPGHALGQLGLKYQDQWMFISDVFQGLGSVVVEEMDLYIKCLESLLSENETMIFIPSHGFPIQGRHQLKHLLEHRLKREAQVKELYEQGCDENQILSRLYPDLDEKMQRYALKNIQGHLERILSFK